MRLIDADALMRSIDINWGCNKCKAQCVDEWGVCSCVVHQLKEIVMTAPTIPQWIPVSERLPEEYVDVLVSPRFNDAVEGFLTVEGKWRNECGYYIEDVTAWMPLPEPYKVGDNNG